MTELVPLRLKLLTEIARAVDRDRDYLHVKIREALGAGHSIRSVARASGVSARTVQRIAERDNG